MLDELASGTLLRWIDPQPGQKPLGIVIAPPGGAQKDAVYVLMADDDGTTDVEVFIARPEATGFDVANLIQQSMEVVDDPDPELAGLLRMLAPNWWHISAHLEGEHDDEVDLECSLCQETRERVAADDAALEADPYFFEKAQEDDESVVEITFVPKFLTGGPSKSTSHPEEGEEKT